MLLVLQVLSMVVNKFEILANIVANGFAAATSKAVPKPQLPGFVWPLANEGRAVILVRLLSTFDYTPSEFRQFD